MRLAKLVCVSPVLRRWSVSVIMLSIMPDRHLPCNPKAVRTRENYAQLVVASTIPARHTLDMKNLARIRDSRGLTQTQLADMVGANQATISKIEKGVGNPTLSMIQRIADALKCDPADLFNTSGLRLRVLAALEAIDDPARAEADAVVLESMAGRRD